MDINSTLLLAILFTFVIAFVFSMFGQGGGSVYSPLLILFGYSVLISTSTSLVLNLITSLSAGYIFYRKKMIDYKTSFIFAPGISLGAFAGGALSKYFDTTFLLWLFFAFLVILGARMVYSYWEKEKKRRDRSWRSLHQGSGASGGRWAGSRLSGGFVGSGRRSPDCAVYGVRA